jgi:hypothetical protein
VETLVLRRIQNGGQFSTFQNGGQFSIIRWIQLRIAGYILVRIMRPDQHKKKKNSDYKKKHGIPSEKGEKHDKKGSTGAHRSDEKPASDVSKSGLETDGTDRDVRYTDTATVIIQLLSVYNSYCGYSDNKIPITDCVFNVFIVFRSLLKANLINTLHNFCLKLSHTTCLIQLELYCVSQA